MEKKITALKVQQKNPNRINIYLDGEYAFSVERIVAAWLSVGKILDDEKVESLQEDDSLERAFQKAVRFIDYRPRSELEVEQKLVNANYPMHIVQKVMEKLRLGRVIGDELFAQMWIENRNEFRPRSRRLLAFELRRKGIRDEIIEQTLVKQNDEEELALKAAKKYSNRLIGLDRESFRKRMLGFLARRGFSFEVSREAENNVWSELNAYESESS